MHTREWLAALGAMTMSAAAIAACGSGGGGASAGGGPVINAKFADLQNVDTPTTKSAEEFASKVAKYTGGKVKIKVYPNAQLGTPASILQGLETGTVQFYATPDLSEVVPDTDAIELPYAFPNEQVASKVLNGPEVTKALWGKFPAHGIQVLGVWSVGYTDIYSVQKPINTVSDLKGMRIRIFDPGVGVPLFKALEADAVTVPSTQVVTALSTHTIDGADDPPSTMAGSKWTSAGGYLAMTHDTYVPSPVLVNAAFMKRLSASQQAAVKRAFKETVASNLSNAKTTNDSAVKSLQASGIKTTTPDPAEFKARAQSVYSQIQGKFPQVVSALRSAVSAESGGS
jgi:C4-dicarboxylate-binding protein DctP